MIQAIGIDAVEIERFAHWHRYSTKQLLRIFSSDEITYAFSESAKQAERLAVRFAAKEAFLKALNSLYPEINFSLLVICALVEVHMTNKIPTLKINRRALEQRYAINCLHYSTSVSLTHTRTTAIATVVIGEFFRCER